jgi:hypothetical protein
MGNYIEHVILILLYDSKYVSYVLTLHTLLEKGPWVSACNPVLVSARLADTIYRIQKIRHFLYRLS